MNTQNPQLDILIKAFFIAIVSLFLGIIFDYFFYTKIPGIAFPLYILLIVVGLFTFAAYVQKQISKQALWLLIPLMFFSSMVFVRASVLLTFLNIGSSVLLLLIIGEISLREKLKNFLTSDYIRIFFLPFKFIHPLFQTLLDICTLRGVHKNQKIILQVVKGIGMALPVLVIFLFLFSSADLIFEKYLTEFINFDIEPETILRSVLILLVTLSFIGGYSYIFQKTENGIEREEKKSYTIGTIESAILLGLVNVLFFVFILVQLKYFFGGEGSISVEGFTYAEYARKGFFELLAAAIISFLLLFTTEKYIVRKDTQHTIGFKILSSTLIVQVMVIITSAFMRLLLYEEAYGFTTLRLYSHAFIIFLAVIFILLLYKIFKNQRESTFAFHIFISINVFLIAMNLLNPDAFIARRNIERFATTEKIDSYYLLHLSDDAVPEILNISNEDLKKDLASKLYLKIKRREKSRYFSGWQSLNIARMKAEEYQRLFEEQARVSSYE